jgi:hypothetical protein
MWIDGQRRVSILKLVPRPADPSWAKVGKGLPRTTRRPPTRPSGGCLADQPAHSTGQCCYSLSLTLSPDFETMPPTKPGDPLEHDGVDRHRDHRPVLRRHRRFGRFFECRQADAGRRAEGTPGWAGAGYALLGRYPVPRVGPLARWQRQGVPSNLWGLTSHGLSRKRRIRVRHIQGDWRILYTRWEVNNEDVDSL